MPPAAQPSASRKLPTIAQKKEAVSAIMAGGKASNIARQYHLSRAAVSKWVKKFRDDASQSLCDESRNTNRKLKYDLLEERMNEIMASRIHAFGISGIGSSLTAVKCK